MSFLINDDFPARNMLHSRGLLETTELGERCDPEDHEEAEDMIVSVNYFNYIIDTVENVLLQKILRNFHSRRSQFLFSLNIGVHAAV